MQVAATVVDQGNPASVTDGAVGCSVAYAGVRGGLWNVLINLKDIRDEAFVGEMRARCAALLGQARALRDATAAKVDAGLIAG
jgi:glutamate formiminotransferase/formiminotetrahydrofolate cyclodeaminase